jgi:YD repeat-containing protein
LIVSQIAYQPFGGIQSFVNGAGKTVTRGFDLDGRITSYTLGTTTQALGYDAASRISFISDAAVPANTGNYSYDDLDRLTQYTGASLNQGFGYDATGNRISQVIGANTYSSTISPTSNRLAQITGPAVNNGYAYDANGSRINDATGQYGYDARGRMVSATTAQGVMQYQVNALGQRVQKSTPAGTTLYHYDGNGQLIGESTALGVFQKEYVYLSGMPVALFQ